MQITMKLDMNEVEVVNNLIELNQRLDRDTENTSPLESIMIDYVAQKIRDLQMQDDCKRLKLLLSELMDQILDNPDRKELLEIMEDDKENLLEEYGDFAFYGVLWYLKDGNPVEDSLI